MASKFQNRLIGTVILVAFGVIALPSLLDGKKKHYEDQFAAIPLVPKPGDSHESETVSQVNQALPALPPEGAGAAVKLQNESDQRMQQVVTQTGAARTPDNIAPPIVVPSATEKTAMVTKQADKVPETKAPDLKVAEAKVPEVKAPVSKPMEVKHPPAEPEHRVEKPIADKAPTPPKTTVEKAPVGQAYVVQLGALKNAAKVNEIVAMLRLSGYRAYTVPSTPVQGQVTRLYVGPDASRDKLQAALPELSSLSGLKGQVRAYNVGQ